MNKKELIERSAVLCGMNKKDCNRVLNAVLQAMTEALIKGDTVKLVGFGTFFVKKLSARTGRNPRTREEIQIPEKEITKFRSGKVLSAEIGKRDA